MKFNDMLFYNILWNCVLCFLPMNENIKNFELKFRVPVRPELENTVNKDFM